jgi:hypothetical protein
VGDAGTTTREVAIARFPISGWPWIEPATLLTIPGLTDILPIQCNISLDCQEMQLPNLLQPCCLGEKASPEPRESMGTSVCAQPTFTCTASTCDSKL